MNVYEALYEANRRIIMGETVSADDKKEITGLFIRQASDQRTVDRFLKGVNAPDDGRAMYPHYYIPPYKTGKYRLITGELPKTHILSANHYELEIMRLLALWQGDTPAVRLMLDNTLKRLEATCFGRFCPAGECVGAGIIALRFYGTLLPAGHPRTLRLLYSLGELFMAYDGKASSIKNLPFYYFLLTLSDIQLDDARALIDAKKNLLTGLLTQGWRTGPAESDTYNVLRKYVLRNALSLLPEYTGYQAAEICISEKDGRCYCRV